MTHNIAYYDVPRETFASVDQILRAKYEPLNDYIDYLFWWNKKLNLVSRDVSRETINEHVRHSLLIKQFNAFKNAKQIVDAGTGGGLPGIPLAIASPDKQFILNDIVTKKIFAIKQIGREMGLNNVKTAGKGIRDLEIDAESLSIVSKHAFKIKDLYNYTAHLPWKSIILYKAIQINEELKGLADPLDITIYKLYPNSGNAFYKGKGIIIIKRSNK